MEPNDELQVPHLRQGMGSSPSMGGCIMQVIDWIERGGWSDKPPSVHPVIRVVAIAVNDQTPTMERQKLLDLIPRIRNTYDGDFRTTALLEKWVQASLVVLQRRPSVDVMVEMLDYYDHITGRTPEPETESVVIDFTGFPPSTVGFISDEFTLTPADQSETSPWSKLKALVLSGAA